MDEQIIMMMFNLVKSRVSLTNGFSIASSSRSVLMQLLLDAGLQSVKQKNSVSEDQHPNWPHKLFVRADL